MINYGSLPLLNPTKLFAIGDIHGDADKLNLLLTQIEPLIDSETHLIFCGDLINRGLKNPEVLEIITRLYNQYPNQVFIIMGNHEWMLLHYFQYGMSMWFKQYTMKTCQQMEKNWNLPDASANTIKQALIDKGIWNWFQKLIPYYETEKVLITHAPLDRTQCAIAGLKDYDEDIQDPENYPKEFLLDRNPLNYDIRWQFTDENDVIPEITKFRICGHQFAHHKKPRLFKNRAFIDTGCGCKENRPLTALEYPSKKIYQSD